MWPQSVNLCSERVEKGTKQDKLCWCRAAKGASIGSGQRRRDPWKLSPENMRKCSSSRQVGRRALPEGPPVLSRALGAAWLECERNVHGDKSVTVQ